MFVQGIEHVHCRQTKVLQSGFSLAAITPDQEPFGSDGGERCGEATTEVNEREKQQGLHQSEMSRATAARLENIKLIRIMNPSRAQSRE
jgi:hypothetical protein